MSKGFLLGGIGFMLKGQVQRQPAADLIPSVISTGIVRWLLGKTAQSPRSWMMSLNWNGLRAWNGSRNDAFEELCCQLASTEAVPQKSRFRRKGTPDAGVECYWSLPNGQEWAWQAKFFLDALEASQWKQLDESIATALDKHPNLSRYIVCLPRNLSDGRVPGKKSESEKWSAYRDKWQEQAHERGRTVEIDLWGESQLVERLSREEHRGRHWFWFESESLTNAWFKDRVDEAVENAGERYSPEVNVDLKIRDSLEAFGRTPKFWDHLAHLLSEIDKGLHEVSKTSPPEPLKKSYESLMHEGRSLLQATGDWIVNKGSTEEPLTIRVLSDEHVGDELSKLFAKLRECRELLWQLIDSNELQEKYSEERLRYHLRLLASLDAAAADLNYEMKSGGFPLANRSSMLLTGYAGQGKTHLLCDVARSDTYLARPRLLFHGEQFRKGEPWSQMIQIVGLNCSQDTFIGALEAAAQANNCRILLLIDAINEGDGKSLWPKFMPGMLKRISRSQWVGICFSIRTDYESFILPKSGEMAALPRVEHRGFIEEGHKAALKYFKHFEIEPSTRMLLPEFGNPLFLKLFCTGLRNMGLRRMPPGLEGITAVFDFFIESVDQKLSQETYLDYDISDKCVAVAVKAIGQEMAANGTDRLSKQRLKEICHEVRPSDGYHKSLIRLLESEGVITFVPVQNKRSTTFSEAARFTYQRLSDHMIVSGLIDLHLGTTSLEDAFSSTGPLGKLFQDDVACRRNRGLLEAMIIQLPERYGKEFVTISPHIDDSSAVAETFLESLIWRAPETVVEETMGYIEKFVTADVQRLHVFFDVLLALATIPGHPLNATYLDNLLSSLSLAERDELWSIFLHFNWQHQESSERLVNWAWEENDKSVFGEEVVELAGIALAWTLTSANRFLRDRATKGLVRLFEEHLEILRRLIARFKDVNDPYVTERLLCAAYGCVLRRPDSPELGDLALDVFDWIFRDGRPPVDVVLRDHARAPAQDWWTVKEFWKIPSGGPYVPETEASAAVVFRSVQA